MTRRDRLRLLAEALAVELSGLAGFAAFRCVDGARGEGRPLGSGRPGRFRVFTDKPLRGIALDRRGAWVEWVVDDGRGLVRSGHGRGPGEIAPDLWGAALELLPDPQVLTRRLLIQGSKGLPVRGPKPRRHRLSWAGEALATPIAIEMPMMAGHWVELMHPLDRQLVRRRVVRELMPAAQLAERVAGAAVDYLAQCRGRAALRASDGPDFLWLDDDCPTVDWPRPAMPCRLSNLGLRPTPRIPADWDARLREYVADESPRQRRNRLAVADERREVVVYLPRDGDRDTDGTGQRFRYGGYVRVGNQRLPVDSEVIAGLWGIGLGVRAMSLILVGESDRIKSSLHRRVRELLQAGADLDAHAVRGVVDLLGLGWTVETPG